MALQDTEPLTTTLDKQYEGDECTYNVCGLPQLAGSDRLSLHSEKNCRMRRFCRIVSVYCSPVVAVPHIGRTISTIDCRGSLHQSDAADSNRCLVT